MTPMYDRTQQSIATGVHNIAKQLEAFVDQSDKQSAVIVAALAELSALLPRKDAVEQNQVLTTGVLQAPDLEDEMRRDFMVGNPITGKLHPQSTPPPNIGEACEEQTRRVAMLRAWLAEAKDVEAELQGMLVDDMEKRVDAVLPPVGP